MNTTAAEMPKYRCHKEVWALKIASVKWDGEGAMIAFTGDRFAPLRVDIAWLQRNPKVEAGGYYVMYKRQDGETENYTAYSPAEAFEEGYTRI